MPKHILEKPFLGPGDQPAPTPYPDAMCVHELLHQQALRTPEGEALVAGTSGEVRLTYQELAAKGSALAQQLRAMGVGPGKRVGIAVERCAAMVIAVWGVIEAGGAYVPIDPLYPHERIEVMLEDAALPWLLTQRHLVDRLPAHDAATLCIETPEAWPFPASVPASRPPTPDDLIYAMYTSGSTGRPKSATIHHRGIVNLVADMARRPGLGPDDTSAAVISLSHDMSVADIFLTLSVGARLVLITTEDAADPAALAARLAAEQVSYISATPTTFRMLLALDWQPVVPTTILMAGEALPKEIVGPLLARRCTIWNGYGMTEASVYSTMTRLTNPDAPITIGGRVANTPIYILDDAQQPVGVGDVGELYVGGVGVGKGYLGRPAMTAAKFLPDPFAEAPDAVMYRSGDLASWRDNGDIECLGRKDQQVKIRGFRVELEEIEARLNIHEAVAQAVVIAWDAAPGDKRLLAYLVLADGATAPSVIAALRRDIAARLPDYMHPSQYMVLDEIPLTPAGKLDRKALPAPTRLRPADAPPYVPPAQGDERQRLVCELFSSLCQIQPMGLDDDFFRFGGHSLLAAQLVARLRDALGQDLPIASIFQHPTPRLLAPHLEERQDEPSAHQVGSLKPIPRATWHQTSSLQQNQWFIAQLDEHHPEYHVNLLFGCTGQPHHGAMAQALTKLLERHEILRTTYHWHDGALMQQVHPTEEGASLHLEWVDADDTSDLRKLRLRDFFRAPFDLEKGPLWRAQWLHESPSRCVLLLCIHHIAIDGWSIEVLFRDLCHFYQEAYAAHHPDADTADAATQLAPLPVQYVDYAHWEQQRLTPDAIEQGTAYWRQRLQGAPSSLALPEGLPLPTDEEPRSTDGTSYPITLSNALTQRLRQCGETHQATLFMTLMSSFGAWLAVETGQLDLPIGTVFADRTHVALEPMIGFVANTAMLRLQPQANDSFAALLNQTRRETLGALQHQSLPFSTIVNAIQPARAKDQQALFNVCFILQAPPTETVSLPAMDIHAVEVDNGAAPFDMTLQLWETDEGEAITGNLFCRNDRIPPGKLPELAQRYLDCLEALIEQPQLPILHHRSATLHQREQIALAAPAIQDAHALMRTNQHHEVESLLYVVTDAPPTAQHVRVSHIPLREDGAVDAAVLYQLPILDPQTLHDIQTKGDAPDAAVVAWSPPPTYLTLDELLPSQWLRQANAKEGKEESAAPAAPPAQEGAQAPALTTSSSKPAPEAPLALIEGPPLAWADDAPTDLPAALRRAAETYPDHGIATCEADGQRHHLTYGELLTAATTIASGLQQAGCKPGAPILLQLDTNVDFFCGLWGCLLGGFVAAPLMTAANYDAENSATQKLFDAWKTLEEPPLLTSTTTEAGLHRLAQARGVELTSHPIEALKRSERPLSPVTYEPDNTALFIFTSGSTGTPKIVPQSHYSLLSQAQGYTQHHQMGPSDAFLNWLPIEHVGGLIMSHIDSIWSGGSQHHYANELFLQSPLHWLQWLEETGATFSWAPSFAFGLVVEALEKAPEQRWNLGHVRTIINGGEAVMRATALRFAERLQPHGFPASAMVPAWGMSEVCSATITHRHFHEEGAEAPAPSSSACVGAPIPGFSIRIAAPEGQTLAQGEIGRLLVKGPSLMRGYRSRPELNQQLFDDEGWFDTGDLGFIDANGLYLTGRSKDEIVIHGINYSCHDIEAAVEALDGVERSFTAACAVRSPGDETDRLALFFVPSSGAEPQALSQLQQNIKRQLARQVGISPWLVLPLKRDEIPKTEIGKIQRSQLKQRYAEGAFAEAERRARHGHAAATVPSWFYQRRWHHRLTPSDHGGGGPSTAWIFCLERGPSYRLVKQLRAEGIDCLAITPGDQYEVRDQGHVSVRPGHVEDLVQLRNDQQQEPDWLLHLWTCEASLSVASSPSLPLVALHTGAATALALLQAMEGAADPQPSSKSQWLFVSRYAQVLQADEPATIGAGALLGLLATLPHEAPHRQIRHVDLDAQALESTPALAALLLAEYKERHRFLPEVAYRHGVRHIPRIAEGLGVQRQATPTPEGLFVLVGGLGGLGREVAGCLQETWGVPLLLVGRTHPDELSPPQRTWLEAQTGHISYESVDIAQGDKDGLTGLIAAYEARWDTRLRGIIHLAALLHDKTLSHTTTKELEQALGPKGIGGLCCAELLVERRRDDEPLMYVDFSSVNGLYGGFGAGAYSASVRIGESLTHRLRQGGVDAYQLVWSRWEELGLSADRPGGELAARRGYMALTLEQGMPSLLACLARPPGTYIIGLDRTNPSIRRLQSATIEDTLSCQTEAIAGTGSATIALTDRFGTPLNETQPTEERPGRAQTSAAPLRAPQNQTERQIAAIWRDVLDAPQVSTDSNFFDLGGHSLLLTQVQQQLEAAFGVELSIISLFRHTTIRGLGEHITALTTPASEKEAQKTQPQDRSQRAHQRGATQRQRLARTQRAAQAQRALRRRSKKDG